jgi:hypothetical protein
MIRNVFIKQYQHKINKGLSQKAVFLQKNCNRNFHSCDYARKLQRSPLRLRIQK